jgi:predicted sugar kinase
MTNKTERLQVRLTKDEMNLLREAAKRSMVSMSDIARALLLVGARAIVSGNRDDFSRAVNSTGQVLISRSSDFDTIAGLMRSDDE